MPGWVQTGFNEYAKRLPKTIRLELVEIAPEKRTNVSAEVGRKVEADRLLAQVRRGDYVIALDETGTGFTTVEFSDKLQRWREAGQSLSFVIGGADGLHASVVDRANFCLSLSQFTLPHALARVLLAEQIYRAWSVLQQHPYHRA